MMLHHDIIYYKYLLLVVGGNWQFYDYTYGWRSNHQKYGETKFLD